MASEIEQLVDLSGFLKLASQPEWRRVTAAAEIQITFHQGAANTPSSTQGVLVSPEDRALCNSAVVG